MGLLDCCTRGRCVRDFFLGNVYLNAKIWFVADVTISFILFVLAVIIANLFNFPEAVWPLGVPFVEDWYCFSFSYDMFWYGSLLDLLFHVIYFVGSIIILTGICTQSRWLCGVYPLTTFIAVCGFTSVRVWVQAECRAIWPMICLVAKEIWFAFGFWFCTVSQANLDKTDGKKKRGVGVADSSATVNTNVNSETGNLNLSEW